MKDGWMMEGWMDGWMRDKEMDGKGPEELHEVLV